MGKIRSEKKAGEYLSITELSEFSGLGVPLLRKAKDKYGLPFYKIGHLVRFKLADFQKWVEDRRHEAS